MRPLHPAQGATLGGAGLDGDQGVVQGRVGDEQGVGSNRKLVGGCRRLVKSCS
jgi:hypothetical protein